MNKTTLIGTVTEDHSVIMDNFTAFNALYMTGATFFSLVCTQARDPSLSLWNNTPPGGSSVDRTY